MGLKPDSGTIFDNLLVPDGVDKDTAIAYIFNETAELETAFPDANYTQWYIGVWSMVRLPVWTHWLKTTQYDYDPIANYDRKEEWSDYVKAAGTAQASDYTYGFNSDSAVPSGKTDSDTGSESTSTHKARISGNIGVTSTQELIKQERDIVDFTIYEQIANDFRKHFCLLIY